MSNQDRGPFGQGTAVVSLVATLTCALPNHALAVQGSGESANKDAQLSTRVAAAIERLRLVEPSLLRDLPNDRNMAWTN
ncbi:MAG TPA: hypothetical protein VGX95_04650 [Xanthobacteraceae bacterium]|jgi:hypothetical protein|nr:hypothetical protein [Xanthobacteraceae bacterium]